MPELCIAIGMLFPLDRLAVGLKTVSLRTQQLPDFGTADLKSLLSKLLGQLTCPLTDPA
ncbi:hypothetical protein Spb1_21800 [Planctopirus ephydatiae]|uniref:Uncharacterized protein n=1 Tax=Planctopirus ephydatiae TaxID=2528019 RepID=A0A518GNN9_9PLAN|nr:hypothetical protein Spb1_21800 [Planctopirus ephydatiae]